MRSTLLLRFVKNVVVSSSVFLSLSIVLLHFTLFFKSALIDDSVAYVPILEGAMNLAESGVLLSLSQSVHDFVADIGLFSDI